MQANKWDDQFRDHGWAEMRKLLDDEMPVRGLPWWRRRGILWLVVLLLAAPALGGAWWWLQLDPGAEEIDSLPVPLPEARTVKPPIAELDPAENKVNSRPANHSGSANQGSTAAIGRQDLEVPPLNPVSKTAVVGNDVVPMDQRQSLPATGTPQRPELQAVESELVRVSAVQTLATLPFASLPVQQPAKTKYEFPDPVKPRLQTGMIMTARASEFPGLSLGMIGRNTFGRSRLGWETGLRLGLQVRNAGPFASEDLALPQSDQDPGQAFNPNEASYRISGPVYYLSLEAPVHLNMRVGPSWKLFTGLRAEYVFWARNPGGSSGPPQLANESSQFLDYARNEGNAEAGRFNRRPFGLYSRLGAEWQLSPRFSLASAFELGLLDLQPARSGFQGRIGGEVQLRWYFTHPTR